MANLTITKHDEECMFMGGRKDCPIRSGKCNPRFYAGCYQYQDTSKGMGIHVSDEQKKEEAKRNAEKALNELKDFIKTI